MVLIFCVVLRQYSYCPLEGNTYVPLPCVTVPLMYSSSGRSNDVDNLRAVREMKTSFVLGSASASFLRETIHAIHFRYFVSARQ